MIFHKAGQYYDLTPIPSPPGELHAIFDKDEMCIVVHKGAKKIHMGVLFFHFEPDIATIHPETGRIFLHASGTAQFRAVIGDDHIDITQRFAVS